VDGGAWKGRSEELAGNQDRSDKKAKGKQQYERPPEDDLARHGSDPSRRVPPEPLYLDPATFAALWPGIEGRLYRRLVRDGFDPDSARDLCQDVASAFLRAPQRVHTREELVERVLLSGYRLSQRLRRREAREQLGDLPDVVLPDVADEVERRHTVEAVVEAVNTLTDRDRSLLLGESAFAALSPIERNRFYVRLHRARRRLRDRLRGWLIGVSTGRSLHLRDDLIAEGAFRAVCLSAAALAVAGAAFLQGGTSQSAVAAQTSGQGGDVLIAHDAGVDAAANPTEESATTPPTNDRLTPVRLDHRDGPLQPVEPESEVRPQSVTVVGTPVVTQTDAAVNPRPPGDDSLLCVSGLRIAPDFCVQHPLRKDGERTFPHP
jgi:DNA-directed RNA polymerase specialized sigma24 family protein